MTAIVSLVVGYIAVNKSNEIFENNLNKEMKSDAEDIILYLDEIKNTITTSIEQIKQSKEVVSSLNLVSKYEDRQNYNAFAFDAQKSDLLNYAQRFFLENSPYGLKFYDKWGNVIAQRAFNDKLFQSGYVTYKNETAYLKSDANLMEINSSNSFNKECLNKLKKEYKNGYYTLCLSSEIAFNEEEVGYVKVVYYFDKEILALLQKSLNHPLSFIVKNDIQKEFKTTLLNKEQGLFLRHHVDFSYFKQKRQEMIFELAVVVVLLSLLIFLFLSYFLKKEILLPLEKLQETLISMLKKKYKPIEIRNNDEIGEIFKASNKIFEHFWQSYSSLQSYQKSLDISNIVSKTDTKGNIIYANKMFCSISEYEEDEVLGKSHNIVRHPDTPKEVFNDMWSHIKKGKIWKGVIKNRTKNGGYYWTDAVITPTYDLNKKITGYISIRRDITELMNNKDALEFRANNDLLTNLSNRNKLQKDLQNSVKPCLALINIDRFSEINDFYGHEFGDKCLKAFALALEEKVKTHCQTAYKLYRNTGDEFVILIEKYSEEDELTQILLTVFNELEKNTLMVESKALNLHLSCGISFQKANKALLCANMALKISKKEQKLFVVYTEENSLEKEYQNNLLWSEKLKIAIDEDKVVPFFQPIVNNKTLMYEKYESLVRIVENDGKVISPFFFLDIAKQTKQYLQLTKIMVNKSFEMFAHKALEFSINITIEDISNEEMRVFLLEKIQTNPHVAKRVVFELVESESIKDYNQVVDFISKVKSQGCKIAIDDFGTGYSNFEYLIKLQADYIKIDGSLIKNINTQKESLAVVSTIVNFAKQMNIKTIAEFIEDDKIFEKTKELGIDYSQGYYFQAPQSTIKEDKVKVSMNGF